jgi:hypothetical protein
MDDLALFQVDGNIQEQRVRCRGDAPLACAFFRWVPALALHRSIVRKICP